MLLRRRKNNQERLLAVSFLNAALQHDLLTKRAAAGLPNCSIKRPNFCREAPSMVLLALASRCD